MDGMDMMPSKLRRPRISASDPAKTKAPHPIQHDASNFDFRVVPLLTVLITRQDLLREYLEDGKEKDKRNIPLALHDPEKWKTLRTLFDPDMLATTLYLFELAETQQAALHLRRVFQTMISTYQYSDDTCPPIGFVENLVDYSGQQTAELNPAGIADNPGSRS